MINFEISLHTNEFTFEGFAGHKLSPKQAQLLFGVLNAPEVYVSQRTKTLLLLCLAIQSSSTVAELQGKAIEWSEYELDETLEGFADKGWIFFQEDGSYVCKKNFADLQEMHPDRRIIFGEFIDHSEE